MPLIIPSIAKGDPLMADYFNTVKGNIDANREQIKVIRTTEPQPDEEGSERVISLRLYEVSKKTSTERVYNPDDEEMWVDVKRRESSIYSDGTNTIELIHDND